MRKIGTILLITLLIISLSGCNKNDLEDFKAAVAKTQEINRGQISVNNITEMDFDTKGLTPEEIKYQNYFKKVETNFNETFNKEENKMISRNYFNFGGLGFDMVIYMDGEEMYIKMPMIGKYLMIDEGIFQASNKEIDKNDELYVKDWFISENTQKEITDTWLSVLEEENVFSGEDSVMSTPDGEVKVTHYTIKLTGEETKILLGKTIDILSKDPNLEENVNKIIQEKTKETEKISLEEKFKEVKELIEASNIKAVNYNAYIDIDGYIVKEDLEASMSFIPNETNKLKDLKYSMEINRWSINKKQDFEFPTIDRENIIDFQKMNQEMPSIFEDILGK